VQRRCDRAPAGRHRLHGFRHRLVAGARVVALALALCGFDLPAANAADPPTGSASFIGLNIALFPEAPDLAGVTRPRLDRITDQPMHALSENLTVLGDPKRRDDVLCAMHPMQADDLSAKAVAEAIAALAR